MSRGLDGGWRGRRLDGLGVDKASAKAAGAEGAHQGRVEVHLRQQLLVEHLLLQLLLLQLLLELRSQELLLDVCRGSTAKAT